MRPKYKFNEAILSTDINSPIKLLNIKNNIEINFDKINYSVVDKKILPASGNKQDYHSIAIYAWPNPETENGLPYIIKDGIANPSNKTFDTDSIRIEEFANNIMLMSVLYMKEKNKKYTTKINELLERWFIDSETSMNPNMEYAQAIPGKVTGRGIGLIDARHFIKIIDYVQMFDEMGEVKEWFLKFVEWMENSQNGKDEEQAHNNHGSWYEAEYTSFAAFIGDTDRLLSRTERFVEKVKSQITPEGDQPHEAKRKKAWHYFIFNLEAILIAYRNLQSTGKVHLDEVKHLIEKSADYLIYFLENPAEWPKKDDSDFWKKNLRERKILPFLWELSRENSKYEGIVSKLAGRQKMEEIELLLNTQNDYTVLFPVED